MKIENKSSPLNVEKKALNPKTPKELSSVQNSASKLETPEDSIHSTRLQKLRQTINQAPDVDMKRVEQMKAKIAAGEFKRDPQQLATAIYNQSLKEDLL